MGHSIYIKMDNLQNKHTTAFMKYQLMGILLRNPFFPTQSSCVL